MKKGAIIIAQEFIAKVLEKESWFKEMKRDQSCDLLLLTDRYGSKQNRGSPF